MKASLFTLGAIATTVLAQDISGLSQCGQTCATNMLGADKAEELGCKPDDLRCLCLNKNFIYGLRDCSTAICKKDDAEKVVAFGLKVCSGAGVSITTGSNGQPTGSSDDDSSSSKTGGAGRASATPSGDSDEDDKDNASGVSTVFSTKTSDGTTLTTAVSTVTGDDEDAKDKVSSKVDDLNSKVESVSSKVDSVSSKAEDAKETATKSESEESSATSSGDAQASETGDGNGDDEDAASALVAGPAALVAAAVAAMLF